MKVILLLAGATLFTRIAASAEAPNCSINVTSEKGNVFRYEISIVSEGKRPLHVATTWYKNELYSGVVHIDGLNEALKAVKSMQDVGLCKDVKITSSETNLPETAAP